MRMNKTQQGAVLEKLKELSVVPGLYEYVMEFGFVAGGAIRDLFRDKTPKDWDIFFKTEAAKNEFVKRFGNEFRVTGIGNYNFKDFQFITIRFGSPENVIDTFDWNVNQTFFDPKIQQLCYYDRSDYLRINTKTEKPLSAIMRLPYMLEKGFKIGDKELLFALTFVSSVVDLKSQEAVEKQHEYMSAGGYKCSVEGVVERAVKEALKQSPLSKALL